MFDLVDVNRLNELKVAPHFQKLRFGERFSDGGGEGTMNEDLKLLAFRMSDGAIARVTGISHFPGKDLDVALLSLELEDTQSADFKVRCPMASRGAFVGDKVLLCGHPKDEILSLSHDKLSAKFSVTKSWKPGTVTGHLHWNEDYFVRSPGLLIDTGCPPGYSGGPVLIRSDLLDTLVLVGIISSSDEHQTKASLIWPALPLKHTVRSDDSVPTTLLGLFTIAGAVTDLSYGSSHIMVNPTAKTLKDHVIWQ